MCGIRGQIGVSECTLSTAATTGMSCVDRSLDVGEIGGNDQVRKQDSGLVDRMRSRDVHYYMQYSTTTADRGGSAAYCRVTILAS